MIKNRVYKRERLTSVEIINGLNIQVSPKDLKYIPETKEVIVSTPHDDIKTSVNLTEVKNNERSLFYAAAGIRNFMRKNGYLPDEKRRYKIIQSSIEAGKYSNEERRVNDEVRTTQPLIKKPTTKTWPGIKKINVMTQPAPLKEVKIKSARRQMNKYGIDIDPIYISYSNSAMRLNVNVGNKIIRHYVSARDSFYDEELQILIAAKTRSYIQNFKKAPDSETFAKIISNTAIDNNKDIDELIASSKKEITKKTKSKKGKKVITINDKNIKSEAPKKDAVMINILKELGLEFNPYGLSLIKVGEKSNLRIRVRSPKKGAPALVCNIGEHYTNSDTKALFFMAVEVREYMIQNHKVPSKAKKEALLKISRKKFILHSIKNRDIVNNRKKKIEERVIEEPEGLDPFIVEKLKEHDFNSTAECLYLKKNKSGNSIKVVVNVGGEKLVKIISGQHVNGDEEALLIVALLVRDYLQEHRTIPKKDTILRYAKTALPAAKEAAKMRALRELGDLKVEVKPEDKELKQEDLHDIIIMEPLPPKQGFFKRIWKALF